LIFSAILKTKPRRSFVLVVSAILIAALWYVEKTKQIPQYGIVFYEMGLSCKDGCGQDKQLQYFQKAVRYKPMLRGGRRNFKLSDAHYRLALIYEERGEHARSLESLMKAIKLYQNAMAHYKLGRHYFSEGAYEYAKRHFRQCVQVRDICPGDTYYRLAKAYDQIGEYNLAINYYLNVIPVYPEHVDKILLRLAEIYYFPDQEGAAARTAAEFRKYHKNDWADQLERNFEMVQASEASSKK